MTFAERIKELREEKGLTQAELGAIAGVTDKAVSTWEKGLREPRMGAVEKLAEYFHLTKSFLLGLEETAPKPKLTPEQQKILDLTNKIIERLRTATPEQLETVSNILDAYFGK